MKDVPKDFKAQGIFLGRGTNGQTEEVWQVHGTGNHVKREGGSGWSAMGWEFTSKEEAQKFYDEYKAKDKNKEALDSFFGNLNI